LAYLTIEDLGAEWDPQADVRAGLLFQSLAISMATQLLD
jgi:hypothetical protein